MFGVSNLHSKDLRSTKGQFKDWDRARKIEFLAHLFGQAKTSDVCGLSVSFTKGLAKSFQKAAKQNHGSLPLGMAFGVAISQVCSGTGLPQLPKNKSVAFVVERGNKNNAQIKRDFSKLKSNSNAPLASSLSFERKNDSYAIQLADFWALYSRRLANESLKNGENFNITRLMEPKLKTACELVPHAMDINFGTVSQRISQRSLLDVGITRRFWLHSTNQI